MKKKLAVIIALLLVIAIVIGITVSNLKFRGDLTPFIDSVTTVFSIAGLLFTIKRCIEQWYIWTLVNGLSVIMWVKAYLLGSNCFATILMWLTYFILGLYFLYAWKRKMNINTKLPD